MKFDSWLKRILWPLPLIYEKMNDPKEFWLIFWVIVISGLGFGTLVYFMLRDFDVVF
jgi:hypothetical protein